MIMYTLYKGLFMSDCKRETNLFEYFLGMDSKANSVNISAPCMSAPLRSHVLQKEFTPMSSFSGSDAVYGAAFSSDGNPDVSLNSANARIGNCGCADSACTACRASPLMAKGSKR